jgi:hypothetical protein
MSLFPQIDVLYWTASHVYIKCPYYEEVHRHGVALPGKRVSHCYPGGHYEFILPVDESSKLVGYEIDKRRARFVNAGLLKAQGSGDSYLSEQDESDLDDLFQPRMNISATSASSEPHLSLYKGSAELKTYIIPDDGDTFEQKEILMAISDCVNGNIKATEQYLSTSPEQELFLTGRFESEDATLIKAAMEKSHDMVSLLLQHKVDVNAINNQGRSALMEAALWGRFDSVKALLNADADKSLRDKEGRCAMDLAKPTRKKQ